MKTITSKIAFSLLAAFFLFASCSSDDTPDNNNDPDPTPQPTDLMLVAIDTARVVVMTATGTNQTVVLDRLQNLNSYFGGLSISPDGSKFAYSDYQMTGEWPDQVRTRQIRVANADGTGDHVAYEAENTQVFFEAVKFCDNNKIFFAEITAFPDATRVLKVVNADGTGLETLPGQHNVAGVSNELNYYVLHAGENMENPIVQIIDRNGDNGAGGVYHNESFAGEDPYMIGEGVFTKDGKKVVIPFTSGSDAKARIIDMETKASTTITIVGGITSSWFVYNLAMASDSNRGVATIAGEESSMSYVFNLSEGTVAAPFENNDDNVMQVYAH